MTTRTSVESYGAAMLDLLVAASEQPITLRFATKAAAVTLRAQIYRCRAQMRREGHFLLSRAEGVIVPAPTQEGEEWLLIPQPVDDIIRNALNAAGVKPLVEQMEQGVAAGEEVSLPPRSSADAMMEYLGKE